MRLHVLAGVLVYLAASVCAPIASAVTFGQLDDFQDGTTQGWRHGGPSPNPPVNVADAGPLGVGDHALRIPANGNNGPGGLLVAFNRGQWLGDFIAAGVNEITADLNNPNNTPMNIRLAFNGPGGRFSTRDVFTLPAGSGWQTATFSLQADDLVFISGANRVIDTLESVSELRILHNMNPAFIGEAYNGDLLVDNFGSRAVPEPSTFVLLLGSAGLACFIRRKRIA